MKTKHIILNVCLFIFAAYMAIQEIDKAHASGWSMGLNPVYSSMSASSLQVSTITSNDVSGKVFFRSTLAMQANIIASNYYVYASSIGNNYQPIYLSTGFVVLSNPASGNTIGTVFDMSRLGTTALWFYYNAANYETANTLAKSSINTGTISTLSNGTLTLSPQGSGDIKLITDAGSDIYLGALTRQVTFYVCGASGNNCLEFEGGDAIKVSTIMFVGANSGILWANGGFTASSPTASAGGGGGNKNREINIPADCFVTNGFTQNAYITGKTRAFTYSNVVSSHIAYYLECTNAGNPNFGTSVFNMDKQWDNGTVIAELTFCSSSAVTDNGTSIVQVGLSSSPLVSASWTIYTGTVTLVDNEWETGTQSVEVNLTGNMALFDGRDIHIHVGRDGVAGNDTTQHSVYYKNVKIKYTVD